MMLIGLAGQAGSGKSTVANYLTEVRDYREVSLDEPIRAGLQAMLGLSAADMTDRKAKETVIPWLGRSPRQLMQTLGTEWGRQCVHGDLWLKLADRVVDYERRHAARSGIEGVVVSDLRFDNEAEWLRGIGGQVWHLYPTNSPAHELPSGLAHPSEQGITRQDSDAGLINEFGRLDRLHRSIDEHLLRLLGLL